MIRRLLMAATIAAAPFAQGSTTERCQIEKLTPGQEKKLGRWIEQDNWLSPGYLRAAQIHAPTFMPSIRITPPAVSGNRGSKPALIDLAKVETLDPTDEQRRSLHFILSHRIDADAMVAMRNGKIIAEYFRDGTDPGQPRMLLSGGRPILSLLAAVAISQGHLAIDKAVGRALPGGTETPSLRKLSVRRLLDGEAHFAFNDAQLAQWRDISGWRGSAAGNLHKWLASPELWEAATASESPPPPLGRPEDDLLAWVVAESQKDSLSSLLCDNLLAPMRAEHPALWLTDGAGNELAAGLALAPRDLALVGQFLLDNRLANKRGAIPEWLMAALSATATHRTDPALSGFPGGSELRYGFVRLGGKSSRIALLGPYGTSLLVDFDRRTVVALFATHASPASPLLFATLDQLWQAIAKSSTRKSP